VTDEESKLLRSTGKMGQKRNGSDPFNPELSMPLRRGGVVCIHALSLTSVIHLGWVSFVLKNPANQIPEELFVTALIFASTYLVALLLWIITIPFFGIVATNTNVANLINRLLYESISYISPFKASQYTSARLNLANSMRVYEMIRDCYYNEVMVVLSILLSYLISVVLVTPQKALILLPIISSEFWFFLIMLVMFYGAGSAMAALLLRAICLVVGLYKTRTSKF